MLVITVNQLNNYVKSIFEGDSKLKDVYIKGEVSNFKAHYASGHIYFSLKGEKSAVRAVMFRGYASRLKFLPEDGMSVLVRASVGLYEVDGTYQIYVTDIQPDGVGAMEIALRQLTDKLEKLGYFFQEHKKPLPSYPETIGVITSKTGAAFGDIEQVLSRRYPLGIIKFYPATVQGELAVPSLIQGIKALDNNCDVIIIGRGGGSKEDLWAFNNEELAAAIYNATTPIVSAVGHEMDITICDMVADHRAPTPSAAAELVAPSANEIKAMMENYKQYIAKDAYNKLEMYSNKLASIKTAPILNNPILYITEKKKKLDFLCKTMYNIQTKYFIDLKRELRDKALILDGLSPFAVLGRGYSAVFIGEKSVRSAKQLKKKDVLLLKFADGEANAIVQNVVQNTKLEKGINHE